MANVISGGGKAYSGVAARPRQLGPRQIFDRFYEAFEKYNQMHPCIKNLGFHQHYCNVPVAKKMMSFLGKKSLPFLVEKIKAGDQKLNGLLMHVMKLSITDLYQSGEDSTNTILSEKDISERLLSHESVK